MQLFTRGAPVSSALVIGLLAFATIGGAWIFQYAGHPPCDLCYEQRYAYYLGVPLAVLIAMAGAAKAPRAVLAVGFVLLAAMFFYNCGLAIYHSGVEAKLWAGPTACTGGAALPAGGDLLQQLQTVKVVRCDEVSLRVFGLSLANWNIAISAVLGLLAAGTAFRRG